MMILRDLFTDFPLFVLVFDLGWTGLRRAETARYLPILVDKAQSAGQDWKNMTIYLLTCEN
jgi:hypothetical protein